MSLQVVTDTGQDTYTAGFAGLRRGSAPARSCCSCAREQGRGNSHYPVEGLEASRDTG